MHWGIAELPVYAGTERHNSLVGGASLWVLKGKSPAEYKAAAAFLNWIAQPEQALFWSTNTGYIPVTKTGYDFMVKSGFYDKAPYKGREVAIACADRSDADAAHPRHPPGRHAADPPEVGNAMQAIFSNQTPVQQALDDAAKRGNTVLAARGDLQGQALPLRSRLNVHGRVRSGRDAHVRGARLTAADTQSYRWAPPRARALPKRLPPRRANRAAGSATKKRAIFKQQLARLRLRDPAAAADLHLLLLARQPGASTGPSRCKGPGAAATNGSASTTSRPSVTDPVYWNSVVRSLVFAVLSTGLSMGIGAGAGAAGRPRARRQPDLPHGARLALCHRRPGAGPRLPLHAGAGGRPARLRQPHLARHLGPDHQRQRGAGRHHLRLRLEICRLQLHLHAGGAAGASRAR